LHVVSSTFKRRFILNRTTINLRYYILVKAMITVFRIENSVAKLGLSVGLMAADVAHSSVSKFTPRCLHVAVQLLTTSLSANEYDWAPIFPPFSASYSKLANHRLKYHRQQNPVTIRRREVTQYFDQLHFLSSFAIMSR
jgi:hypothetical protein